jgi:hypothetical protein
MRFRSLAAVTAASLAAFSLVDPTSATSAASGNGAKAQLSAIDHPEHNQLEVFERAGGRGGNNVKSGTPSGAATAFSTSTTLAASSKTTTKITTTTKTNAPEATQSPDPDKTAAERFFDLTHDHSPTDCDVEVGLRLEGTELISNAGSVAYPDWAKKVGTSMEQWANATACPEESWAGNNAQMASLNATAGRLVAGNETTIA